MPSPYENALEYFSNAARVMDIGRSIERLLTNPQRQLKVDGRHIRGSSADSGCPPLVRAVIALGKKLSLGIVAEAVETQEQLTALQDEDCDFGQGHYFSEPMTADEFGSWRKRAGESPKADDAQVLRFPPSR